MNNVHCHGNETNLLECGHESVLREEDRRPTDCSHQEDVSVACHVPDLHAGSKVRLAFSTFRFLRSRILNGLTFRDVIFLIATAQNLGQMLNSRYRHCGGHCGA